MEPKDIKKVARLAKQHLRLEQQIAAATGDLRTKSNAAKDAIRKLMHDTDTDRLSFDTKRADRKLRCTFSKSSRTELDLRLLEEALADQRITQDIFDKVTDLVLDVTKVNAAVEIGDIGLDVYDDISYERALGGTLRVYIAKAGE